MRTLPSPALAPSKPLFDPALELARQRDRHIESRRAFVDTKHGFVRLAAEAGAAIDARLHHRLRRARRPADLLDLQQDLADALPVGSASAARLATELLPRLAGLQPPR